MWKMLEEIDSKLAKEEKKNPMKKAKKIQKARERMGAGENQPSIVDKLRRGAKRGGGVQDDVRIAVVGEHREGRVRGRGVQHDVCEEVTVED